MNKSSLEFRQMQRERIMKVRPWLNSTGAKTVRGKERSKMNALKMSIKLYALIKEIKEFTKQNKATNRKASIAIRG